MKKTKMLRMFEDRRGQGLTEYIVLVVLVCIISIAAVKALGSTIKSKIQVARDHINSDVSVGN